MAGQCKCGIWVPLLGVLLRFFFISAQSAEVCLQHVITEQHLAEYVKHSLVLQFFSVALFAGALSALRRIGNKESY